MSAEDTARTIDMIRWTFTIDPARRRDLEQHLVDLGLEVHVTGDDQFVVIWEEPDGDDFSGVIEEIWEVHGSAFEVTHEEFHRLNLSAYHPEDTADGERAVA